jgi:succinate dehydrogenase / fumarate reductase flavoprotein subunit
VQYAKGLSAAEGDGGAAHEVKRQHELNHQLLSASGEENPFRLWRELGELMTKNCTVIRYNKNLDQTDAQIVDMQERFKKINLSDKSQWANTSFAFTRQLGNMLHLARVVTQGARLRDESRGAHYKPDFPERDDERFLKTTKAKFGGEQAGPRFEYEEVDTQYIKPRPRRYDAAK